MLNSSRYPGMARMAAEALRNLGRVDEANALVPRPARIRPQYPPNATPEERKREQNRVHALRRQEARARIRAAGQTVNYYRQYSPRPPKPQRQPKPPKVVRSPRPKVAGRFVAAAAAPKTKAGVPRMEPAVVRAALQGYTVTDSGVILSPEREPVQCDERGYYPLMLPDRIGRRPHRVFVQGPRLVAYLRFGAAALPAGYRVVFHDGNNRNFAFGNLALRAIYAEVRSRAHPKPDHPDYEEHMRRLEADREREAAIWAARGKQRGTLAIRYAKRRGYRVTSAGRIMNPHGEVLRPSGVLSLFLPLIREGVKYPHLNVSAARFAAYWWYGTAALKRGVVTLVENGDKADLRRENLRLGSVADSTRKGKVARRARGLPEHNRQAITDPHLVRVARYAHDHLGVGTRQVARTLQIGENVASRMLNRHTYQSVD